MFVGPMVAMAMDCDAQAPETAVRYSSLSAACCALQFCPVYVGRLFFLSRQTCIAEWKRNAMSPQYAALILLRMVWPMEIWLRCSFVDGAKMSMSR
jgi:hypothetical protein